ncbi:Cof-type HAD-IIB family hydrolase [Turicibacter sp. H121]|uniref:Cof-type HAD-IIB family hydrolase n=1 Tax=Turicibacter sp. H121 TaxID=1712675 RepID=UPI0006DC744E|nr:Cof-type HAD-IIB family hydrolase [Turicibacter sp. H121]AMC08002.1 haloacid dehalogenase [Turicibacter sp. H121]MCU7198795.1 Cof-type HAD-IIB family hydrolase [Turicibacter sp. H121]
MKKAIFFDIDGTLIDCINGHIDLSHQVKQAIRRLQQEGHYAFIATGRPYAFLSEAILSFGFDGYILTNGAQVMIGNETIYKEPLDPTFVKNATAEFEQRQIQYMLQSDCYSYMKDEYKEYYQFFDNIGVSRNYLVSDYQLEDVQTQKIELLCPNDEAMEYCLSLVEQNPEYDYVHSISERMFELYSKKNTKATGILTALKHLGIPVEQSYAFGDGKNDIEMLSIVGCGIAMGNASDEVKSYAHQVTDSVLEDGVATGIEKYILI